MRSSIRSYLSYVSYRLFKPNRGGLSLQFTSFMAIGLSASAGAQTLVFTASSRPNNLVNSECHSLPPQVEGDASNYATKLYREDSGCLSVVESKQAPIASPAAVPDIEREPTEWLDITVAATLDDTLPRVLLIGDSITRLYYPKVQELLKGKANVARLSTSKSAGDPALIGEIKMLLKQYRFDIVQVNNGMHGWGYTEEQYAGGLREVHDIIRRYAPQAKVIAVTTTPVRVKGDLGRLDPKTDRVRKRNLALNLAFADAAKFDDLFSLILGHPEGYRIDGVHPNEFGAELEAAQVATSIRSFLP